MKIAAIVAVSENGIIGKNGALPWTPIPEDMKRFKELTLGHAVIMGRKTAESLKTIGKFPLQDRWNYVIGSSMPHTFHAATIRYRSLPAFIAAYKDSDDTFFLIGGEQIYREGLQYCDEVYLTRVHESVEGDARFDMDWLSDFDAELIGTTYDARASFYKFTRVK